MRVGRISASRSVLHGQFERTVACNLNERASFAGETAVGGKLTAIAPRLPYVPQSGQLSHARSKTRDDVADSPACVQRRPRCLICRTARAGPSKRRQVEILKQVGLLLSV